MSKPHTPLTREVVNKLRETTELMIGYPKDRAINYLAVEWLHLQDKIKILEDAGREWLGICTDRDRQISELNRQIEELRKVVPFKRGRKA